MNTENKPELYTSPEVKLIEVKVRQVICGSPNGTPEQYGDGTWQW